MKDFVVKDANTASQVTSNRFRIGRHDDGRVRLVYEERNLTPPYEWRLVASTILDDDDLIGYLDAAGVK